VARLSIIGVVFLGLGAVGVGYAIQLSPYQTRVRVVRAQPVQFSHQHHVEGLGIDCRYCHTSVESSSEANIPPTYTCMSCHSQIWSNAPMLEPVRASLRENQPLTWTKIHDLPDFVYFNHAIHVNKGVGCVTCHGRVDKMPLMWKDQPMTMQWCLDCHRNPEQYVRPRDEIFNMTYQADNQVELGKELVEKHQIVKAGLDHCSVCHR
jgi:hypothetical protein